MRLFGYYALHSFINQIRKLFKTWVAIFLIVCISFGAVAGITAGVLGGLADDDDAVTEETAEPEERYHLPTDLLELFVGGILLAVLAFEVSSADKNGSAIFQPADVSLLFSSPLKPQSVLLFRLLTQIGVAIGASIYLLFQIPNLMLNLGLGVWAVVGLFGGWMLLLVYGKLIQILLYTVCSTRPALKRRIRPALYTALALIGASFFLFWKNSGLSPLNATKAFFNAPVSRFIPVWGWIKGFCALAAEGSAMASLVFLGCIAGVAVLVFVIWSIKADFYEDAMAKTEELAELRRAAGNGKRVAFRKKTRSEKIQRDGFDRGEGATVYFWKSLYNRRRFAHLRIFTKTSETYLAVALAAALFLRFIVNTTVFFPVALLLGGFAFFRSLGNPLAEDTRMDSFLMVPESPWKKVFWSLAAGNVNCFLDLLPGMVIAAVLLNVDLLPVAAWMLFIVSMDFYSTNVGVFIDLAVPVSAGKMIKQIIQIMFVYFGLLPVIVTFAIGAVTGHLAIAAVVATAINCGVGFIFFGLSPTFFERGRK